MRDTFRFIFPVFEMTAGVGRPLVAIVEDEPFMAELVRQMLEASDVDVEVFHLGADFLNSPNLPVFKAIVLDLSLPDMEAFDVMDSMASKGIGGSVLVSSGHDTSIVVAAKIYGRGVGLKMCGALTKPFSQAELLAALGLPA